MSGLPKPFYEDGSVTIYHGDARELVSQVEADVLVTDPPYGLGDILNRPGPGRWSKHYGDGAPAWDREAPDWISELVAGYDEAIVWGGNYFGLPPARGWLIWDKVVRKFSSGHAELAWTNLDQPIRAFNCAHGELATEGKFHPTQKPIRLMRWAIEFTRAPMIVDPFMGSGTTLRAAKDLGRKAIGIELSEEYCSVAAERCSQEVLDLGAAA